MALVVKRYPSRRKPWVLDYVDAAGIRRTPTYTTRALAKADERLLVPARTTRGRQRASVDGRVTLEAWLTQWLDALAGTVKDRTHAGYTDTVHNYLVPTLGAVRVADLTRPTIHAALQRLLASGRQHRTGPRKGHPGAGPLAPRTVGLAHTVLHTALERAVDANLLPANPATGLASKRQLKLCMTTKQRRARIAMRILDDAQLAAFERTCATSEPAWLPLLLTYTRAGLRCGEALALELSDFSSRHGGTIRVRQAVNQKSNAIEVEPKNGPRIVDLSLSAYLVEVLEAHAAGVRALGRIPWLFPSDEAASGGRVTHQRVTRAVKRLAKRAGIAHTLSPHDLRHTYATRLLNEPGINLLYVSRQLGHASIQETVDTYGVTAQPKLDAHLVGLFDRVSVRADATSAGEVSARNGSGLVANDAAPAPVRRETQR